MDRSSLVRIFGYRAAFIHGDTLMLDRWRWLKPRLPVTRNGERLLDVGCGSGAFTVGAAKRGYASIGLSWDRRNQEVAAERARITGAAASFRVQDVRLLHECSDLKDVFDIALCFENIEHILDDRKLVRDIYACLRPGGLLLLTAPNLYYRPITGSDAGPFARTEDGGHVRRGYNGAMLRELCESGGFLVEQIDSCSGFLSQKVTALMRAARRLGLLGWALAIPLRIFPPIFDRAIKKLTLWPDYSICLVAYKPRF